ncbi:MAG: beta-N-acetylhexosaminidase [Myxococcales bacterium]|nr:beta-N-acetylhexosaminidase [Myxococcales bacterium]
MALASTRAAPAGPTLRELAGQVLVAGAPGPEPDARLLDALAEGALGGVVLFKRNLTSAEQAWALLGAYARAAPGDTPPLLAVDQEGGRVARLGPPVLPLPPMRRLAALGDTALTRAAGAALGRQLAAIGFTMDFAPVLDVDTNPDNPIIGDRAFGADPQTVAAHALAFAQGLLAGGVLPCGKHFPGHGDTHLDSHLALPALGHDRARLDAIELAPFRDAIAAGVPALMTAHVVFEAFDPMVPATLSRRVVTGLLREELGFEGAIVSDDLEMKAVCDRWGVVESAVRAIDAGCDLLLVCSDVDACLEARDALTARAERDGAFRRRLTDAAERSRSLRRLLPPGRAAPDLATLRRALGDAQANALAETIAARDAAPEGPEDRA